MSKFGLIGKNIDYSFSRAFFSKKFERESLLHSYENFDIPKIEELKGVLLKNKDLKGLNVTIPFKESVIPHLDSIDETAQNIGAVNTIKISEDGNLKGFNTDCWGFQKSLEEFLPLQKKTALILGTGGASKAVAFALDQLGFTYKFVSRSTKNNALPYSQLNRSIIQDHLLIVNSTPLGTFPKVTDAPAIPYEYLTKDHLLFDLIYNPEETKFLSEGKLRGSRVSNGLKMLEYQAEKAWEIWNS